VIRDVYTVAWKEWQEYLQQEGTRRVGPVRAFALIAAGGAFIGWQLDADFGRSWLTVLLTMFLAVMFVTTVVPDSFAGERERHTLETLLASRLSDRAILLGKVVAAVGYGVAIAVAVMPAGIAAAHMVHGSPGGPRVEPAVIAAAVALALLGGLLIAAIGVNISLYAETARQAHQRLGFVILGLFLTPAVAVPAIPAPARAVLVDRLDKADGVLLALGGFGLLAGAVLALLLVALRRLHRGRLVS